MNGVKNQLPLRRHSNLRSTFHFRLTIFSVILVFSCHAMRSEVALWHLVIFSSPDALGTRLASCIVRVRKE